MNETLKRALQETYQERKTFEAPGLRNHAIAIEDSYVNLALVPRPIWQEENPEYGFPSEPERQTLLLPVDRLFTLNTQDKKEGVLKRILILGRAGIGKSTLCHYLVYQWAQGRLFTEKFAYVFWVPLKMLDTEVYRQTLGLNAATFLYHSCLSGKYTTGFSGITLNEVADVIYSEQCLMLLDGYDEVTHLYASPDPNGRVLQELLKLPHSILTSRPTQMNATLGNQFDRCVENRGFTDDNIRTYVQKIFKDEREAASFLSFLQENASLYGIAYIPLNLFLLCDFWREEKSRLGKAELKNMTLTKLYQNFFHIFLKKRAVTCQWYREDQILTFIQLKAAFSQELSVLSELAFRHLYPKVDLLIRFSAISDLLTQKNMLSFPLNQLRDIGFLKPTQLQDRETDYYFIHKTFQEFFAAYYLVQALKAPKESPVFQEAIRFIEQEKYYPPYALVFWFLAGLLHEEKEEKAFSYVRDALLTTAQDWVGLSHILLMMQVLEQSEFDATLPGEILLEDIQGWIRASLSENSTAFKNLALPLSQTLSLCPRVAYRCLSFFDKNWASFSRAEQTIALTAYLTPLASLLPSGAILFLRVLDQSSSDTSDFIEKALGDIPWGRLQHTPERHTLLKWLHEKSRVSSSAEIRLQLLRAFVLLKADDEESRRYYQHLTQDPDPFISLYADFTCHLHHQPCFWEKAFDKLLYLLTGDTPICLKAIRACEFFAYGLTLPEKEKLTQTLFSLLKHPNNALREAAAILLDQWGQTSSSLQSHLWSTLEKAETPTPVPLSKKRSLLERREAIFRKYLSHSDILLKIASAKGLLSLHSSLPEVIPVLMKALGDEDLGVRRLAVSALGQIKQASPEIIAALLKAERDKDSNVRESVVLALGQLGQVLPDIINPLIQALEDEDGRIRQSVPAALGQQLGQASSEVINALTKALGDDDWRTRQSAASALAKLKQVSPEVINALMKALKDEDSDVRVSAASALGQLKQASPEVIHALMKALGDWSWSVRQSAASALGQLKQASPEVIHALMKALGDWSWSVRQSAASALGQLGQASPGVINALIQVLRDKDWHIRQTAASALGKLKQASHNVINVLIQILGDKNWLVRKSAAAALGQLQQASPEVINALMKALKDEDSDVQVSVVSALGQLKQVSPDVIDPLIKTLVDKDSAVRCAAATVLQKEEEWEEEYFLKLIEQIENARDEPLDCALEVLSQIKMKRLKLTVESLYQLLEEVSKGDLSEKEHALEKIQNFYQENSVYWSETVLNLLSEGPHLLPRLLSLLSLVKCSSLSLFLAYKAWIPQVLEQRDWQQDLWCPLVVMSLAQGASMTYRDRLLVLQCAEGKASFELPEGARSQLLSTLLSCLKKAVEKLRLPLDFQAAQRGLKKPRYVRSSSCLFSPPLLESSHYTAIFNPQLRVDHDHWALSLIRKADDPHVFMIIEGMNAAGEALLQRIDLTTNEATKGNARIVFLNVAALQHTGNISIKEVLEGALMPKEEITRFIEAKFIAGQPCYGFVWTISREQFKDLMQRVRDDQKQGERLFSRYGSQSFFSSQQEVDNCFTWSCRHLRSLGHPLINRDLKPQWVGYVAAHPAQYLTTCLRHERPQECLMM